MSQLTTVTNGTSPWARLEAIGCCHIREQARKKLEGRNGPSALVFNPIGNTQLFFKYWLF